MYQIKLNKSTHNLTLKRVSKTIKLVQTGRRGLQGEPGLTGQGVPDGGSTGQFLAKDSDADYDTGWKTPQISDISGLQSTLDDKLEDITGLITDGTNVTITGSGTSVDPYEIAASGGGGSATATFVVAPTGGDYTDIQDALDNIPNNGGKIYIADGTYTVTSTLLIKKNRTRIEASPGATIQCDGASVTPLIKPNTTSLTQIFITGGKWLQTNATAQGVAFDMSDCANHYVKELRIENFGQAIQIVDANDVSYYSAYRDIQIFDCNNGILLSGTQANDNYFSDIRIRPKAGGAGTGIKLEDARASTFIHCNVEPATATGITGISVDGTCRNNAFINCYLENNATNVSIASGANRTTFVGCNITSPGTTNISDSGTQTAFLNTDDNGAVRNNPGALSGTLVANDVTLRNGSGLRTATSAGNTLALRAFDVDGASYTTFVTLTANNTPTMDLDEAVTKAGQYIYRGGGTDVPVVDGGTGASDASGARTNLGIGNVDNTSDLNKPISTATQTALNAKAIDADVVHLTGNETVAGIKTFSSSPIVPTPTTDFQAATKKYVDDNGGGGGTVDSVVAGTNIDVDATDPANPIVSVEALTPADIGLAATVTELDYVDGVTSSIQTQLGNKQPLDADLTALAAANNSAVLAATTASFLTADETKLDGIEALADVTDATNVTAAGAFMKSVDDTDDITVGGTNKFATAAEKTKLSHITVTQAVDLDAIETNANNVPGIKTKTDFITVTQAVDLDTMESDIAGKQPLDADLTALAAANNSAILAATTASFLTAQQTKLGFISVTQAVDLDTMESDIALKAPLAGPSFTGTVVANDVTLRTGSALRTATSAGNTLALRAFDVDGASYTTFATLTANNTPTMDLAEAVTKAGNYIYRAAGTDVPITDGGTGGSTAADARTNLDVEQTVSIWRPEDNALLGWSYDPVSATTGTALPTNGTVYVVKIRVPRAMNITNIIVFLTAGVALTAGQNFAGLYQGGTLLGTTADQTTPWATSGLKTMAIAGGAVAVAAGYVYVAFFANGATRPSFVRAGDQNATLTNVGLAASSSRYGSADTGRTTTLAGTIGAITAIGTAYWAAIS